MYVCKYVLWSLISTTIEVGDFCCNHCDSKIGMLRLCVTEIIGRFYATKTDMMRLCATQKRYVAAIETQNCMLWLCSTEKFARLYANQNRYDAALRDAKQISCDFGRLTQRFAFLHNSKTLDYNLYVSLYVCMYVCMFYGVWLPPGLRSGTSVATIATQNGYVATLCDQKNCAILRNLNQICCDFARPKKMYFATIATQNGYVANLRNWEFCATLRDPKQIR